MGSRAWCGAEAWPPRPITVMRSVSDDAMIVPPRRLTLPLGANVVTCRAKAASTGLVAHVEQAFLEHELGAVVAFLAGLEHEEDLPGQIVTMADEQAGGLAEHGDVEVVAAGVHGAVDARRVRESGVFRHRQGVHVAAQQDRRAGAGSVEDPDDARGAGAGRQGQAEAVDGLEDAVLSAGQVEADLGLLVEVTAHLDGTGEEVARLVDQGVEHAPSVRPPTLFAIWLAAYGLERAAEHAVGRRSSWAGDLVAGKPAAERP